MTIVRNLSELVASLREEADGCRYGEISDRLNEAADTIEWLAAGARTKPDRQEQTAIEQNKNLPPEDVEP